MEQVKRRLLREGEATAAATGDRRDARRNL